MIHLSSFKREYFCEGSHGGWRGLFHFEKEWFGREGMGKSIYCPFSFPVSPLKTKGKVYLTFVKCLPCEVSFFVTHTDVPSLFLARHTLQIQLGICSLVIVIITCYFEWQKGKTVLKIIVSSAKIWSNVGFQQAYFMLPQSRNYKTATVRLTKLWKYPHPEMDQFSMGISSIRMQVNRDSFENLTVKGFYLH